MLVFAYNYAFNQWFFTQRLYSPALEASDFFGSSVHVAKMVDGTMVMAVGAPGTVVWACTVAQPRNQPG